MVEPEGPRDPSLGGDTEPPSVNAPDQGDAAWRDAVWATDEKAEAPASPPETTPASPADDWPAVGYWVARSEPAPPPPPTWTKTYELPSARQVVSSGLQLAVASNAAIRRASIYVGLLSLGAFGPAVILLLVGIGRLMGDPRTADTLSSDPSLIFFEQPELLQPLMFIYLLLVLGLLLLVAISVDAQAIAISLLGASASDRPMRLREAITRARQVFWRLLGAGLLVGLASGLLSLVIALPFLRPLDTNEGISFIASMIGTLAVTPFAFAAAGIVLGDVGAIESLRRSIKLFRARPRIALVVTLFTLVTSAIQTFAIGAGADVAIRVAEFLHLGLDQGGPAALLTGILVLAFIVAFGSLTVTIAAIVAAPQVAGFLGMTFYAGGLDRALVPEGTRSRGFRWVTLPMLASMVGLALIAVLGTPLITDFQPRAAGPLVEFLRTSAAAEGAFLSPFGEPTALEDPAGDHGQGASSAGDILAADLAYLPEVPDWLLSSAFDCHQPGVACGDQFAESSSFTNGAYLFAQRMAGGPRRVPDAGHSEWGPVLLLDGYDAAPNVTGNRFSDASHLVTTELDGEALTLRLYVYFEGRWEEYFTTARSAWREDVLLTIVPVDNFEGDPSGWDAYAAVDDGPLGRDDIRDPGNALHTVDFVPWIQILDDDFFGPIPTGG